VQAIQRLRIGEAFFRLMDDSVHKLRTPTLPQLTVTRQQLQAVREQYLDRYFVPAGVPISQSFDTPLSRRIARRGSF
jgi:hypothetical protein